jgi:predicted AAA+ superfamily ATPase
VARSNTNPKKIYCIDHSLANSVSSGILTNFGHLLENIVFTALRRGSSEIYYYKTRNGREVDFIVKARGDSPKLIQACESMVDGQTRKREIAALNEAMREQHRKSATIVTRNDEERIEVDAGIIDVVPAWRFLISLQED